MDIFDKFTTFCDFWSICFLVVSFVYYGKYVALDKLGKSILEFDNQIIFEMKIPKVIFI